jgi:hypothetical protein
MYVYWQNAWRTVRPRTSLWNSVVNAVRNYKMKQLNTARSKGHPYPKHKVDRSSKDLPTTGEPNTSVDKLNPDGSIKQRRYYGPDGKAQEDIDYNHGGSKHTFPHRHKWDWSKKKPRQGESSF